MSAPKGGKFWASVSIQLPMLPVVAMNYYELPLFAVFVNLIAVSYTHLDVYKRQAWCAGCRSKRQGRWALKGKEKVFKRRGYRPVSYTHLDVYKRQVLYMRQNRIVKS